VHDCLILEEAKAANEPDPMIFKAQVSLESGFNVFAISPDSPCGIHIGWTDEESKSFGLMQLTPACGWLQAALNPDGHPNMTKDMASDQWATSVFNPLLNIAEGVRAIQVNRATVTRRFPGCTEVEYTGMALAASNRGSRFGHRLQRDECGRTDVRRQRLAEVPRSRARRGLAEPLLAFHRPSGEARDDMALKDDRRGDDRQHGHHGNGRHLAPWFFMFAREKADRDRYRSLLRGGGERERVEKLVVSEDEDQNARRRDPWHREG
jgi:hypothetical protein